MHLHSQRSQGRDNTKHTRKKEIKERKKETSMHKKRKKKKSFEKWKRKEEECEVYLKESCFGPTPVTHTPGSVYGHENTLHGWGQHDLPKEGERC